MRAGQTFADELLAEQRDLSAVTRYAEWHKSQPHRIQPGFYRDLIPLTQPSPGHQYAFEVDLDKCSGCKSCVSACHSLNGLDAGEAWREVGLLVSDDWRHPFQQAVTTACHHCVEPACLNGCPVLAYDKDPFTGIVRHLDDQCIGCQYCVLKCPYDVPKYSTSRGIVRKCDMCSNRLAVGEAPACVQSCPHEAIRISIVDAAADPKESFLRIGPDPSITSPTTRFISTKPLLASLRAVDREQLRPEPPHLPLVVMLVLSQFSAGLFLFGALGTGVLGSRFMTSNSVGQTMAGFLIGLAAVTVSIAHLGRPAGAWRSFLGLRRSWLSREIVGFGFYLLLSGLSAGCAWLSGKPSMLLSGASAAGGFLGVFCSGMVYHDTRREFWKITWTAGKFFGSTIMLGAAGTLLAGVPVPVFRTLNVVLLIATVFKLAVEQQALRHLNDDDFSPLHKTALLLTERFGVEYRVRFALGIVGGILIPALLVVTSLAAQPSLARINSLAAVSAALICLLAGELIERRLFFIAVQPVKMPGTICS